MTSGRTSTEVSEARAVADAAALAAIADLIVEMRDAGLKGWSTASGERTEGSSCCASVRLRLSGCGRRLRIAC